MLDTETDDDIDDIEGPYHQARTKKSILLLTLGALGVIYGDLGTSPLYTMATVLSNFPNAGRDDIIGATSAIIWSLFVVVTIKYVIFVLSADYRGEGGTFSLLRLLRTKADVMPKRLPDVFQVIAVIMTCSLLADGVITPAISVTSAIEGLTILNPDLGYIVVPVAIAIIFLLFVSQSCGSNTLGWTFGPIMVVWFFTVAALGIAYLVRYDNGIWLALSPHPAVVWLGTNGVNSLYAMGATVLSVTGTEALYADLGHFGALPIRLSWSCYALPCLALQYLGQGAFLLSNNNAYNRENVYFAAVPQPLLVPVLVISTIATVIASQAIITGSFTVTSEATSLGLFPRITVAHTSSTQRGQIYVREINYMLMVLCIAVVAAFQSSQHMAALYGVAVTTVTLMTSVLLICIMHYVWNWRWWQIVPYAATIGVIDIFYWVADLLKVPAGGYVTVIIAFALSVFMLFWRHGQTLIHESTATDIKAMMENYLKAPQAGLRAASCSSEVSDNDEYSHYSDSRSCSLSKASRRRNRQKSSQKSNAIAQNGSPSSASQSTSNSGVSTHMRQELVADKPSEAFAKLVKRGIVAHNGMPGTVCIFVTQYNENLPLPLQRLVFQFTRSVPGEKVVLLTVKFVERPFVPDEKRFLVTQLAEPWLFRVSCRLGFAESGKVVFIYDKFVDLVLPKLYGYPANMPEPEKPRRCETCCQPQVANPEQEPGMPDAVLIKSVAHNAATSSGKATKRAVVVSTPEDLERGVQGHEEAKYAYLAFYTAREFVYSGPSRNVFHRLWVRFYDLILRNSRSQRQYLQLPNNKVVEVGAAVRI